MWSKKKSAEPLSASELQVALMRLVQIVQSESLIRELELVRSKSQLLKRLGRLSPFIDPDGILRVGRKIEKCFIAIHHLENIVSRIS